MNTKMIELVIFENLSLERRNVGGSVFALEKKNEKGRRYENVNENGNGNGNESGIENGENVNEKEKEKENENEKENGKESASWKGRKKETENSNVGSKLGVNALHQEFPRTDVVPL